jgi:hypothetical protein
LVFIYFEKQELQLAVLKNWFQSGFFPFFFQLLQLNFKTLLSGEEANGEANG